MAGQENVVNEELGFIEKRLEKREVDGISIVINTDKYVNTMRKIPTPRAFFEKISIKPSYNDDQVILLRFHYSGLEIVDSIDILIFDEEQKEDQLIFDKDSKGNKFRPIEKYTEISICKHERNPEGVEYTSIPEGIEKTYYIYILK